MIANFPAYNTASRDQRLGVTGDGAELILTHAGSADDKGVRVVELRLVFPQPVALAGVTDVRARVDQQELNCSRKTSKEMSLRLYRSEDASGTPVKTIQLGANGDVAIDLTQPASLAAALYREVCAEQPTPTSTSANAAVHESLPESLSIVSTSETNKSAALYAPPSVTVPKLADPEAGAAAPPASPELSANSKTTVMTLRDAAWLAYYVYYDRDLLELADGVLAKLEGGLTANFTNMKKPPGFLMAAIDTEAASRNVINEALVEKAKLLDLLGLDLVSLPYSGTQVAPTFKAELYRQRVDGQYVLVFRGSMHTMDWVTNLWLGVDLIELEAPHYEAARKVTAELLQRNIRPLVLGHSLGAGLAQYVAALYGLDVVGFNSSPLPRRYLGQRRVRPSAQVRILSAVEQQKMSKADGGTLLFDPVSIGISSMADIQPLAAGLRTYLGHDFAHEFLGAPNCVLSNPVPVLSSDEDRELTDVAASVYGDGAVKNFVIGTAVTEATVGGLRGKLWQPDDSSERAKEIATEARRQIGAQLAKQIEAMKTAGNMLGMLGNAALGNSGSAFQEAGVDLVKGAGTLELKRWLMVHDMARFARGMRIIDDSGIFSAKLDTVACP